MLLFLGYSVGFSNLGILPFANAKVLSPYLPADSIFEQLEIAFKNQEYALAGKIADTAYIEAVLAGKEQEKLMAKLWQSKLKFISNKLSEKQLNTLYREINSLLQTNHASSYRSTIIQFLFLQRELAKKLKYNVEIDRLNKLIQATTSGTDKSDHWNKFYLTNTPIPKETPIQINNKNNPNSSSPDTENNKIKYGAENPAILLSTNYTNQTTPEKETKLPDSRLLMQKIDNLSLIIQSQTNYINLLLLLTILIASFTFSVFILYLRSKSSFSNLEKENNYLHQKIDSLQNNRNS